MTQDFIYKKDIYFPSYSGTNDNLIKFLNKTSQILCDWFSNAEKYGPLPIDENFKCLMPDDEGSSQLGSKNEKAFPSENESSSEEESWLE